MAKKIKPDCTLCVYFKLCRIRQQFEQFIQDNYGSLVQEDTLSNAHAYLKRKLAGWCYEYKYKEES
jgi:hypothetical protein